MKITIDDLQNALNVLKSEGKKETVKVEVNDRSLNFITTDQHGESITIVLFDPGVTGNLKAKKTRTSWL